MKRRGLFCITRVLPPCSLMSSFIISKSAFFPLDISSFFCLCVRKKKYFLLIKIMEEGVQKEKSGALSAMDFMDIPTYLI